MLRSAVALVRALLPWGLNSTATRVLNRGCLRRFCSSLNRQPSYEPDHWRATQQRFSSTHLATALYVSLESPSSASVSKSLPFSRRQTRFAVEHGGLTQGVPDLTTLVLFTTRSE